MMRHLHLPVFTRLVAALGAAAALALPGLAQAQTMPSYATPVASQESIKGTLTGFNGQYIVYMRDDRGYDDHITLHDGTVINPTGIKLVEGMKVTMWGRTNGSTFEAYRIDVSPPDYSNSAYGGGYGGGYYGGGWYPGYYGGGYGGWGGYPGWGVGLGFWGGWPGWGWGYGWPGFYGGYYGGYPGYYHGPYYNRGGFPRGSGTLSAPPHGGGAPHSGGMSGGGGSHGSLSGSSGGGRPPRLR